MCYWMVIQDFVLDIHIRGHFNLFKLTTILRTISLWLCYWCFRSKCLMATSRRLTLFFLEDSSWRYKNTLMEHIICSMVQIKIVRCIACSNSNDYLALYIMLRFIETFFCFFFESNDTIHYIKSISLFQSRFHLYNVPFGFS